MSSKKLLNFCTEDRKVDSTGSDNEVTQRWIATLCCCDSSDYEEGWGLSSATATPSRKRSGWGEVGLAVSILSSFGSPPYFLE